MKKILFMSILLLEVFFFGCAAPAPGRGEIRSGDIIFQTSLSSQSRAIQLATHSPYSHCGIINEIDGKFFVFEAVEPVKTTPLEEWIARGKGKHYVIKRLKNADQVLTPAVLKNLFQEEDAFKGKHYDIYFDWSDEKIYCSELIWKVYKAATGLEVGRLQQLKDFDLTSAVVKEVMRRRYGNNIPFGETVISPMNIFESNLLTLVKKE